MTTRQSGASHTTRNALADSVFWPFAGDKCLQLGHCPISAKSCCFLTQNSCLPVGCPLQRRGRVCRRPAFGAVGQRGGAARRQAQVRRTPPPAQPRQVRMYHVPQLGRRGRSGIHVKRRHLSPAAGQFGVGC